MCIIVDTINKCLRDCIVYEIKKMASDTVWVQTHKALNDFIQLLTCKKCHKKLSNPQQFLNCGHFSCAACVGSETDCVQCKIPGDVSDIISDTTVNDLLYNLNVIAETVGLDSSNYDSSPVATISTKVSKEKPIRQQIIKNVTKPKTIDETLNTSICESTISRTTQRSKANENIPKNLNKKNKKGETALHIACRSGNLDRVKLLLEAGANPNTKDNAGWTPLQEAANYGYYNVCETLLKSGANPDIYGYDNRTALHEAVMIDDCDLASLLINSNASRKVFDNVGKQPKDYCKSKKMLKLFKTLQDTTNNTSVAITESHRTLDLDRSLNHTVSESKIILYGSHLKQSSRKDLIKLGLKTKLKIANHLSPSVSHVIIDAEDSKEIILTFDVLLTILYGKWLLSSDCLSILKDSKNISSCDLSLFEINPPQLDDGPLLARENEIKQNPKLFNNCYFYFAIRSYEDIHYDKMHINKEELMKLVSAGDGITLTREPKPDDIQGSLSPFHVAHDPKHSLHKCTHYIIYVPENSNANSNSNRIMYNMPFLKTLPLMWFIESILRFKLIDPIDLGLSTIN